MSEKERSDCLHDLNKSRKNVECWKAHILTVVNQEKQKTEIIENLHHKTAFIITDFAMKFVLKVNRIHDKMVQKI